MAKRWQQTQAGRAKMSEIMKKRWASNKPKLRIPKHKGQDLLSGLESGHVALETLETLLDGAWARKTTLEKIYLILGQ